MEDGEGMSNTVKKTVKKQKRGNPNLPKPGPGRPKNCKNKFTNLKQAFLNVFGRLGGENGLLEWVESSNRNRELFYHWITKMLPTNIDVDTGENLKAMVERIFTDNRRDVE